MKKILIFNGHPNKNSFNYAISQAYHNGAKKSKAQVKQIDIADIKLDVLALQDPKAFITPDKIIEIQKEISWADHLVFVHPTWWASMPALLKVFFEQTFTSGFAGKYDENGKPIPLLNNKSARIICTMDSPTWYFTYFQGNPILKTHKANLNFCGIKPVKATYFGPVVKSDSVKRKKWLEETEKLGQKLA